MTKMATNSTASARGNDGKAVALAVVPILVVTSFWVIVGVVIPFFIRGPNRRLIQTMLALTAVCCWLFWICTYMCQLNPLIGPEIDVETIKAIVKEWGRRT